MKKERVQAPLAALSALCLTSLVQCAKGEFGDEREISLMDGAAGKGTGTTHAEGGAPTFDAGTAPMAAVAEAGTGRPSALDAAPSGSPGAVRPGSQDAGSGRAEAGVDAGQREASVVRAWRPFGDDSPWNTRVAVSPALAPDSAALIADFATSSAWPYVSINIENYSIPVYWVDATTPVANVQATLLAGQGFVGGRASVPIPENALAALGTDRHLCVIDRRTNQEWGFWDIHKTGVGAWSCRVGASADLGGTGVRPLKDVAVPKTLAHGARACGFPLAAGLITVEEMRAGRIDHVLAFAYPHIRSHWYTYPASTAQVTTDQALPTRGIPCGGRIQLDPTLNLESLGLSRSGLVIARALQEYGALVGDFSGAMSLYADASPQAQAAWRGGLLSMLEVQTKLDLRKFRVLAMGQLHEDDN
ncbi:MAG TPA: hypothetical protein VJT73_18455 [Polyangiaceae bacterium]|nr:hypothetical protein [Polyangiaceae bacterium]